MEKGFGQSDPEVVDYAYHTFAPEDDVLAAVREESRRKGLPEIQVGAFDGLHLEVLVRMAGATKAVEIGTLGGYSGIAICRGLRPGGILHTFEMSAHHAEVARSNFERAGFQEMAQIHVGPALENLTRIEREAPFDLVFIDADKTNYPGYLEWATNHLRIGGVVIADNTFAWGLIHKTWGLDEGEAKSVECLRQFNQTVASSARFRATILPTAEGLTVAVKIR